MNKNIKLGFVKSKAYGLCGVILTAALLMIMAPSVYADEVSDSTPKTEVISNAEAGNTTEAAVVASEASSTEETPTIEKSPMQISKEGTTISIKNPDVDMHFTKGETGNGTGKYVNFKIEYKDIKIPDSIPIDEGDKVVFTMPKEVSFRTDFDFDVKNPSNETIGHAQASVKKWYGYYNVQ